MTDVRKSRLSALTSLLAIGVLCAVCFQAGARFGSVTPNGKYLVADKNAVIVAAAMERDSLDPARLKAEIAQPILQLMQTYVDQGYVIVDSGRDEHGNFTIAALPSGTRDITQELAAAVRRKETYK